MKKLLLSAGFTENEAELYFALLRLREGTIDEILRLASIRRPTAYSVMKVLVNKELVAEIPGKPTRFRILSPNQALRSFIQNRLNEMEKSLNKLFITEKELIKSAQEIFEKKPMELDAERDLMILRGRKGIADAIATIDVHKTRKLLSRPPMLFQVSEDFEKTAFQLAEKNKSIYMICESEMLKLPYFAKMVKFCLKYGHFVRHLPSLPIKADIIDDSVSLVVLSCNSKPDESLSILIRNQGFVAFLVRAFDSLWDEAEPVRLEDIEKILKNK